jgi:hypothetical protein
VKRALAAAVALLAVVGIAVALIALAGHTSVKRGAAPAALALGAAAGHAIQIEAKPVGLSIEYPLLARELGTRRCPPAALVRAVRGLRSPTIRIGGDSQDQTAPSSTAAHPGVSDLPIGFWSRLGCLERETGVAVVVGLNLASGEPAWAATMAADAHAVIPRSQLSFELGNEPDIYGSHVPWWNGERLVDEPMPFATYLARARAVAAQLGPASAIEGPDFASGRWVKALPALARTLHLSVLDAHFYPLDACRTSAGASAAALLSRAVQLKLDERVRVARDARVAGLPAVISEANSISCGGVAGVSDSPAAAVWAVRLLLGALRAGFESVRFHSSGGAYDPFVLSGEHLTLRPLYRGLAAAAALLVPGAKLQAIPSARALDGVALTTTASSTDVLSNYSSAPRAVTVPTGAGARVHVEAIVARAPTLRFWTPAPSGARARVTLPPNSVVAITTPTG